MEQKDLIQKIRDYAEICKSLGDSSTELLLKTLQDKVEKHEYLLPFIGQYSAGKSKLINKLLGRDILPTKTKETTAFLTYISYAAPGQAEYAVVYHSDGKGEIVDINDVAKMDYSSTSNQDDITSMTVYVNSDILKSGVVFVDTPGVNTLINSHIEMTEELLKESQFVVYVFGKDPSEQDMSMVAKIQSLKISVIFVRTHMDEINDGEDGLESIEQHNKQLIESEIEAKPQFFAVSCKDNEINKHPWSVKFASLKHYLERTLKDSSEELYTNTIKERLGVIAEDLKKQIDGKLEVLNEAKNVDFNKMEAQRKSLEKAILELENDLQRISKEWKMKCDKKNADLKEELNCLIKNEKDLFTKELDKIQNDGNNLRDAITSVMNECLHNTNTTLNETAEQFVASFGSDCNVDISDSISGIKQSLEKEGVQVDLDINTDAVAEYNNKIYNLQEQLIQKINELEYMADMADSELERLNVKKEDVISTLGQLQNANTEFTKALQDLENGYNPRYNVKQSGVGRVLEKVGSVCDIAMLLIPAAGWEKAGAKLAGKAATLAGKAGKLTGTAKQITQYGAKGLEVASKGMKALAATDKIKDGATFMKALPDVLKKVQAKNEAYQQYGADAMNKLMPVSDSSNQKKANIFDYLSLSYWFRQFGEFIDPPTVELDMEYERKHRDARKDIEDNSRLIIEQTIEERKKLGLINDSIAENENRKKLAAKQKERLQKSIDERRKKLEEEKHSEFLMLCKDTAKKQFADGVNDYKKLLGARCGVALSEIMGSYLRAVEGVSLKEMDAKKAQIEQILTEYNESSINAEIDTLNSYLTRLGE